MSEHAHGPEETAPGEWRKLALLAAASGVFGLISLGAEHFGETGRPWALALIAASGQVVDMAAAAAATAVTWEVKLVNGANIARGEVVMVGERLGIRFTEIITPEMRLQDL